MTGLSSGHETLFSCRPLALRAIPGLQICLRHEILSEGGTSEVCEIISFICNPREKTP